ncbi:MAG: hypothetical protein JST70_00795 [Bacteroidetes bacterium]|nr:hypothetical protein [Bacteroidota bacterium]
MLPMLTGCYAILPAKHDNMIAITKDNLKSLNGHYSNISDTQDRHFEPNLWNVINHMRFKKQISGARGEIKLQVLNDKRINVTLLLSDSLQYNHILKGKVKEGYFVTRKKFLFIGIPLFLNIEKSLKMQFALTSEGNLLVDSKAGLYAAILIAAGQASHSNTQYKRIK